MTSSNDADTQMVADAEERLVALLVSQAIDKTVARQVVSLFRDPHMRVELQMIVDLAPAEFRLKWGLPPLDHQPPTPVTPPIKTGVYDLIMMRVRRAAEYGDFYIPDEDEKEQVASLVERKMLRSEGVDGYSLTTTGFEHEGSYAP